MQYIALVVLIFIQCTLQVYASVNCDEMGRGLFADLSDPECRKYTLCAYVITPVCSYVAYNYTCPVNTVFDPTVSVCTTITNYICKVKPPTCAQEGFVPNPKSPNCSSYVQCLNLNGEFVETVYDCPEGTFYNPEATFCEYDYKCKNKFICSASGLTANLEDKTCQSYYFCQKQTDGDFVSYELRCPGIWKFHPTLKVCTPYYTCPK